MAFEQDNDFQDPLDEKPLVGFEDDEPEEDEEEDEEEDLGDWRETQDV